MGITIIIAYIDKIIVGRTKIIVYIDDIIVDSDNSTTVQSLKDFLGRDLPLSL